MLVTYTNMSQKRTYVLPSAILTLLEVRGLDAAEFVQLESSYSDMNVWFCAPRTYINILNKSRGILKRDITYILSVHKSSHVRIVLGSTISKSSQQLLSDHHIEYVPTGILTFNHCVHSLVPVYTILTKEECESVCQRFNAQPYQWPYILEDDPQVILLGAQPGQLLKNVSDHLYRLVVKSK